VRKICFRTTRCAKPIWANKRLSEVNYRPLKEAACP
jgi:hypothetical protein